MTNPNTAADQKAAKKNVAQNAIKKLNQMEADLNKVLIKRKEVIHSMILAIITKNHVLQYGPPGTAKSLSSRYITQSIDDAEYFEWLLTKGSDVSELFGPVSVKAIQNDSYRRNTTGKLPEAHIAFVDEIFKCNSATLNALLSAINERVFFNDGKPTQIPLISLFAASNEIPDEGSNLEAIYDRFLLRHFVDYLTTTADVAKLMKATVTGSLKNPQIQNITMAELKILQSYVEKIAVPDPIINEFSKLINELKANGVPISDRRYSGCLRLLQGSALLEGRSTVNFSDFEVLAPALWRDKKDIKIINDRLKKLKDPFGEKFKELKLEYEAVESKLKNLLTSGNINDNVPEILSLNAEIKELVIQGEGLLQQGQALGSNTSILSKLIDIMNGAAKNAENTLTGMNSSIAGDDDNDFVNDLGF